MLDSSIGRLDRDLLTYSKDLVRRRTDWTARLELFWVFLKDDKHLFVIQRGNHLRRIPAEMNIQS
jgi:hypothetical protein